MENKKINPLFILVGIALAMLSLVYCSYRSSTEVITAESNSSSIKKPLDTNTPLNLKASPADKIDLHAYAEYTKEGFPKLYEEIGQTGLDVLFKHDMDSAYKVAERDDCDRVMYSAYSKEKSSYPNKIISFVDCKNGNRFYVSQGSVDKR